MPSKDEMFIMEGKLVASSETLSTRNIVAQDVEKLVCEMKENLRLNVTVPLKASASYNHHSIHSKRSRPSPYKVPCRSLSEPACDNCVKLSRNNCLACSGRHRLLQTNHMDTTAIQDDPYAMLQELLKSQSLIKEAVRRLQTNVEKRKNRFSYESEDSRSPHQDHDSGEDARSPVLQLCHLEL